MKIFLTTLAMVCAMAVLAQTPDDLLAAGKQRYDQQNYTGARAAFDSAVALKTTDPEVYIMRGNVRSKLKDLPGALEDYSAAITLKPSARAYHNRGILKKEQEDYTGAMSDYTKAIETDPAYKYAYESRGLILLYIKNDNKAALKDIEKLIRLDPENAEAYGLQGVIKGRLGDHKGGIAAFTKALELDDSNAEYYYLRGYLEMSTKQTAAACIDFTKAAATGYKITDKSALDLMKDCPKGRTYIIR